MNIATAAFLTGAFFGAVATILLLAIWADRLARTALREIEEEGSQE